MERDTHDGPHQVEPPQRPIVLAGGPGAVLVVGRTLDVPSGLFPGGIIQADLNDGLRRDEGGTRADAPRPQVRTTLIQGLA